MRKHMKLNYFERERFIEVFEEVFGTDKYLMMIQDVAASEGKTVGDFYIIHTNDDEWRIIHMPTGIMIGWTHLHQIGRDNVCNIDEMTYDELDEFFVRLKINIDTELSWI